MPIKQTPQFKAVPDKMLEIPQPAIGGLNLKDLEFEQEVNQSPYMRNVMYRNGAFSKRYGQEVYATYAEDIYATVYFGGNIFVHSGTKIYKHAPSSSPVEVSTGITLPETSGLFIIFQQKLYYMCYDKNNHTGGLYEYGALFTEITPYIPDLTINCSPNGESGDSIDDINVIGLQFNLIYNGTESDTIYNVENYDPDNSINWTTGTITIKVDDVSRTRASADLYTISGDTITWDPSATSDMFAVDADNKRIFFKTAPGEGDMNVVMTFTLKASKTLDAKEDTLTCKYYDTYGGTYNSRVFLAGDGKSRYYWCESYDISYWPSLNFATLGNTEDDITGLGRQYNALIAFKPRETYQIVSYIETVSSTVIEDDVGKEYFRSLLVNPIIGCDAPFSIQVINNLLTWFNSRIGICTLVSTNIADERNIRVISRNIDRTNNFGINGILDIPNSDTELAINVMSADFDKKYFLVFPTSGKCFVWDYEISPYFYSSANGETPPARLTWFYFDKIYAKSFISAGKNLMFISSHSSFKNKLIKFNETFTDLDFDNDGNLDAIDSFYLTPFMQFGAVEMLKNVKNMYVQCRGDTNTLINISYYTDDSSEPEIDPEPINVDGGGILWDKFQWDNFRWFMNIWGNVFRRKCNLKKVEMCAVFFENSEVGKDMSITHIGLQYQLVKYVR